MTALRVENIVLEAGGKRILDGVSLELPTKGSVAIIGPNGAGKSSLLRIMAGVAAPHSGGILLDNQPLAELPGGLRSRKIGYVPQQFMPFWDLTADELVRLGLERIGPASPSAVTAIMARFDALQFTGQRWSTLSGGERARVLMAMVLGADPPILLADEPGASLDIRHRISLVDMLARRGGDCLSVVVMHDLDLAFHYFDRIILMAEGRVVAAGSAADLRGDRTLDEVFNVRFNRTRVDGRELLIPCL